MATQLTVNFTCKLEGLPPSAAAIERALGDILAETHSEAINSRITITTVDTPDVPVEPPIPEPNLCPFDGCYTPMPHTHGTEDLPASGTTTPKTVKLDISNREYRSCKICGLGISRPLGADAVSWNHEEPYPESVGEHLATPRARADERFS